MTPMLRVFVARPDQKSTAGMDPEELVRRRGAGSVPLGPHGRPPEEIATRRCSFSPTRSFITGAALPVDGGRDRGLSRRHALALSSGIPSPCSVLDAHRPFKELYRAARTSFLAYPDISSTCAMPRRWPAWRFRSWIVPEEPQVVQGACGSGISTGARGASGRVCSYTGAGHAHTWDPVCLALRPDYRCLALDLRGHGDSEWSPEMNYGIEAHRDDVAALIDHLGLDGLVLVGMSLGGLTALAYAGRHAAKLDALVIVDAGPEARQEGSRRIAEFIAAPAESTVMK